MPAAPNISNAGRKKLTRYHTVEIFHIKTRSASRARPRFPSRSKVTPSEAASGTDSPATYRYFQRRLSYSSPLTTRKNQRLQVTKNVSTTKELIGKHLTREQHCLLTGICSQAPEFIGKGVHCRWPRP